MPAGFLAELLLASTTTSHPASAGPSPSPVARSTRYSGAWRLIGLTLCPRASSSAATCRPSVPVPPTMAIVIVSILLGRRGRPPCDIVSPAHGPAASMLNGGALPARLQRLAPGDGRLSPCEQWSS